MEVCEQSNDSKTLRTSKIEQLFGSKTRVKLLYLFFNNPDNSYFVRELTRKVAAQINSVRRELSNLKDIGIVQVVQEDSDLSSKKTGIKEKKYFRLNSAFLLHGELRNLITKSQLMVEKDYIQQIMGLGKIDYFILTGKFSQVNTLVDILLVGEVDNVNLKEVIFKFEKYLKREINFTLMSSQDFLYRKNISDKFICDILGKKKIIIIDNFSDIKSVTKEQLDAQ